MGAGELRRERGDVVPQPVEDGVVSEPTSLVLDGPCEVAEGGRRAAVLDVTLVRVSVRDTRALPVGSDAIEVPDSQ